MPHLRDLRASPPFRAFTLLILLGLTGLAGCASEASPPAPAPPVVQLVEVERADLPLAYEYPARISAARAVEVRAQVGGTLIERAYTEGRPVRAGDLLFRIDPAPLRAAAERANAQVRAEKARLEQARSDLRRAEDLVARGAISAREHEQLQTAVEQARAALGLAEAAAREAGIQLDYTEVRAPVAGLASLEGLTVGNLVAPGLGGDVLTRITQADVAYAEFSVAEDEFLRMRDLAQATEAPLGVRTLDEGRCQAAGRLDFTDAFIDPATGTARARALFDNADGCLVAGQFVQLRVEGLSLRGRIALPKTAVLFGQQGPISWVVGSDGIAQPRPLKVIESWLDSWIVEGVEPGERVVGEGLLKVRPGAQVRALLATPQAAIDAAHAGG